jgi:CheY-like chemotaxis protein
LPEHSARILLVDDEQSMQTLLSYPLRKEGYTVVQATDGRQALDRFDEQPFDLVVLDLMLPRIDGLEVGRRLRSKSSVPIIILTAKSEEIDKVVGLELVDLSRLESGSLELRPEEVDLGELTRSVSGEFEPTLAQHDARLELRLPARIEAQYDPLRVAQIVRGALRAPLSGCPVGQQLEPYLAARGKRRHRVRETPQGHLADDRDRGRLQALGHIGPDDRGPDHHLAPLVDDDPRARQSSLADEARPGRLARVGVDRLRLDTLGQRLSERVADARDLGLGERHPRRELAVPHGVGLAVHDRRTGDLRLVLGGLREERPAVDVADRVEPARVVGDSHPVIDGDRLTGGEADRIEPEVGGVRRAPDGDEQLVADDVLPVLKGQRERLSVLVANGLDGFGPRLHLDPELSHPVAEELGSERLLAG